jgi:uncharacterized damage-inducible protein DinB
LGGELTEAIEFTSIPEKPEAAGELARIRTIADAQAYAAECYAVAEEYAPKMTEELLVKKIKSPFGEFSGWQYWTFQYDEFWHHRGQLVTYARLLGREIPMLYDYKN